MDQKNKFDVKLIKHVEEYKPDGKTIFLCNFNEEKGYFRLPGYEELYNLFLKTITSKNMPVDAEVVQTAAKKFIQNPLDYVCFVKMEEYDHLKLPILIGNNATIINMLKPMYNMYLIANYMIPYVGQRYNPAYKQFKMVDIPKIINFPEFEDFANTGFAFGGNNFFNYGHSDARLNLGARLQTNLNLDIYTKYRNAIPMCFKNYKLEKSANNDVFNSIVGDVINRKIKIGTYMCGDIKDFSDVDGVKLGDMKNVKQYMTGHKCIDFRNKIAIDYIGELHKQAKIYNIDKKFIKTYNKQTIGDGSNCDIIGKLFGPFYHHNNVKKINSYDNIILKFESATEEFGEYKGSYLYTGSSSLNIFLKNYNEHIVDKDICLLTNDFENEYAKIKACFKGKIVNEQLFYNSEEKLRKARIKYNFGEKIYDMDIYYTFDYETMLYGHHVSPIRCGIVKLADKTIKLVAYPSTIIAWILSCIIDLRYVASKYNPFDIIHKYVNRGFLLRINDIYDRLYGIYKVRLETGIVANDEKDTKDEKKYENVQLSANANIYLNVEKPNINILSKTRIINQQLAPGIANIIDIVVADIEKQNADFL